MKILRSGSVRKFIREEKARIRREIFDTAKQVELIDTLYKKFPGHEDKRNI